MSILKISISNFRGIPNDLILDLTSDGKKPVSLILAGDNGTGKSSITDALEFGLQGQAGKHSIGTLRSLAVDALPKVTITLNDNSAVVREMIFSSNKLRVSNTLPHSRYSISPFVLRRADILRFIETPDHQRQVLFLDYFKGALKSTVKLQDFQQSESDALQSKLEGKLRNKRNLIAKLAEVINIPQEEIPSDSIKFDAFIRGRFQEGVSSRQRGKVKNQQKPLPYNVDVIVKKIRKQSKEISALKKEIRQLSKQGRQIDTTELQAILADAGNRMTEAFHATSPRNYIDRIYLDLLPFWIPSQTRVAPDCWVDNAAICAGV